MTEKRLADRVALITGSSSGIGRAIALLFAEHGAAVCLSDVQKASRLEDETPDTHKLIEAQGGRAIFVQADVSREAEVAAVVAQIRAEFGRLDLVVNCAGIFVRNEIADVSLDEWERVLGVNLTGYFLTIRAAIPLLQRSRFASIVNVSSIHGRLGTGGAATYCATKGAIENLTRQVAVDYSRRGIRCNAIAPGTIKTAMSKPFRDEPALLGEYERRTLLPRLGEPLDVAYAALYLASGESSFVTGHSLVVDGGWTCA